MIGRMFEWGDLFTVGVLIVLEGLLSADNAMVMAVMVLGLPAREHHKALRYGLIGAFVVPHPDDAGGLLVDQGGVRKSHRRGIPVVSPVSALLGGERIDGRTSRAAEGDAMARAFRILGDGRQSRAHEPRVLDRFDPRSGGDVSQNDGSYGRGILGIVAMRLVVGQLLTLIQKYPAIVDGAFIIIAWVGSKLLVEYLHAEGYIPVEIPQWFSLTMIVGIFVVSLVYARREAARHHVRHMEGLSAKDAADVFTDTDG